MAAVLTPVPALHKSFTPRVYPPVLMALQARRLLGLHTFGKGLVALLRGHANAELVLEAAWLLALVSAGTEAHMHVMVKHGGAEAVASALSAALDSQVRVAWDATLKRCRVSTNSA